MPESVPQPNLSPCPQCGHEHAHLDIDHDGIATIYAFACLACDFVSASEYSHQRAVRTWNRGEKQGVVLRSEAQARRRARAAKQEQVKREAS